MPSCGGRALDGAPCIRNALANGFCHQHQDQPPEGTLKYLPVCVAIMFVIFSLAWVGAGGTPPPPRSASSIAWWLEENMDKWWSDLERPSWSMQTQACRTAPFLCPKDTLKSDFLNLTEIGLLVDYFGSDGKEDMLQIQGGWDMGKTSSIQQALCFNNEWVRNAVYVSFRKGATKSYVTSYDQLCEVLESATERFGKFIEQPPYDVRGEHRFRTILDNLVKFQATVDVRIVIFDDLHAIKHMGDEYEGALRLIKATVVEMQKEYASKIIFASWDGLFALEIHEIIGYPRVSSITMGQVPMEECIKDLEFDSDIQSALSRTGRELPTCLRFRRGHSNVQAAEQSLIVDATRIINHHPEACLPILGWTVPYDVWLDLLNANMANSENNGSLVMRPIYRHPSIIDHCHQPSVLERCNVSVKVWVREKSSSNPVAFGIQIGTPFLDSLKKALKPSWDDDPALLAAISIIDSNGNEVTNPKLLVPLQANSGTTPYVFALPKSP